ncbi:MAG: SDR family NAD(P)-dependent oxidoreductase [Planctomycetota bacterium]
MPRFRFPDSTCIVTGASSGIGRCLAEQLFAQGANVVAVARRRQRLEELQMLETDTSAPGKIFPVAADLTVPRDRQRVCETALDCGGGTIDLLVNNAGVGAVGRFDEAGEDRLRQVFEIDFFAAVELTRLCLVGLKRSRQGTICNIGSVLGHRAVPEKSEYSAAKFAIHGWSDALRAELAKDGVNVLLISPSTTRTEFFDSLVDTDADAQSKSIGSWSPQRVAKATLRAIQRRKRERILSLGGKALVYADRVAPGLMDWVLKSR